MMCSRYLSRSHGSSRPRHSKDAGAEETTISIFYYEPKGDRLAIDYPDERLIYFTFTLSVSPFSLHMAIHSLQDVFKYFAAVLTRARSRGNVSFALRSPWPTACDRAGATDTRSSATGASWAVRQARFAPCRNRSPSPNSCS
jgi:hypothetical protein